MITFISAVLLLIAGFLFYGAIVEKIFAPTDEKTPALRINDGIDYVPMKPLRVFLIQLLNIAGTGPIFGALMGAAFGPVVYIWIVLGSIFAGGVHDYMTGMISLRNNGLTAAEITGKYLGNAFKTVMRIFSVILLVLVGTVFTTSPAMLLNDLTPTYLNTDFWTAAILIYYVIATLLPIDKLIGRLYPFFGVILIVMVVSILGGLIIKGYSFPELGLQNVSAVAVPTWPYMFVTVACGAISGFHATQSPIMARCITHEKYGRPIFYGAMLAEGIIALVWAAAGIAFYKSTGGLANALNTLGQSGTVYEISVGTLGFVGGILAIAGVIICPVSSGDTAFRSARLVIADWFGIEQKSIKSRLLITVPLLLAGAFLTRIDFDIIWRYFSWSNQTLAMLVLWTAAFYLKSHSKNPLYSLICAVPASFMSAVCSTYILMAEEGANLPLNISYISGIVFAVLSMVFFFLLLRKNH